MSAHATRSIEVLTPEDVRGSAFTWDGDEALLNQIIATADEVVRIRTINAELLAALEAFLEDERRVDMSRPHLITKARAAIAKARGES